MKKGIALLLALAMMLTMCALVACNKDDEPAEPSQPDVQPNEDNTEDATEEATEENTEENTEARPTRQNISILCRYYRVEPSLLPRQTPSPIF